MPKTDTSVAAQMAKTTGDLIEKPMPVGFEIIAGGFKLGKRNEFKSGPGKTLVNVVVGSALIGVAGTGQVFPIDVRVIHTEAGSAKPTCVAGLPIVRFDGPMFRPNPTLNKTDQERLIAATRAFETIVATEFVAWYRKQDNVPALTARGAASSATSGITLD